MGNTQRIAKAETGGRKRENPVFRRLLDAGHRLLNIIKSKEGHANKELARFASQVESPLRQVAGLKFSEGRQTRKAVGCPTAFPLYGFRLTAKAP